MAEGVRTGFRVGWRRVALAVASSTGTAGVTLLVWARGYPFPELSNAYAVAFGWAGVAAALGRELHHPWVAPPADTGATTSDG